MDTGEVGFHGIATYGFERTLRAEPLAHLYAWGPETGDWDSKSGWQVRWDSPWSAKEPRVSAVARAPWTNLDAARRGLGLGPLLPTTWMVVTDDDPDRALLIARHNQSPVSAELWLLENERVPLAVHAQSGEPLPDVQSALRLRGSWFLVTAPSAAELGVALVWRIDGQEAQPIARIPRLSEFGIGRLRLGRSRDGRRLAIAVEGQPDSMQPAATWALWVDPATGALGEPSPFSSPDGAVHPPHPCGAHELGFRIELPFARAASAAVDATPPTDLHGTLARYVISSDASCLEAIAGAIDDGASGRGASSADSSRLASEPLDASVFAAEGRRPLRCRVP